MPVLVCQNLSEAWQAGFSHGEVSFIVATLGTLIFSFMLLQQLRQSYDWVSRESRLV
jgi:hypothetical protein